MYCVAGRSKEQIIKAERKVHKFINFKNITTLALLHFRKKKLQKLAKTSKRLLRGARCLEDFDSIVGHRSRIQVLLRQILLCLLQKVI